MKAQKEPRMNTVVIHGACMKIVRRLYRAYTACARRFNGALRFQRSGSAARAPCERSGSAKNVENL
jgi:hypothetical protein